MIYVFAEFPVINSSYIKKITSHSWTSLPDAMKYFTSFMNSSLNFDRIYFDFAKAFDRVSHKIKLYLN